MEIKVLEPVVLAKYLQVICTFIKAYFTNQKPNQKNLFGVFSSRKHTEY
jgi:hypothetical protein